MTSERPRTHRAFLPSDLGSDPPSARGESEALYRERDDPRRGRTKYIRDLGAEISHRMADGTLIEGQSAEPIDNGRHSGYHPVVNDDIERMDDVSDVSVKANDELVEAPAPKAKPKAAKTPKARKAEVKKKANKTKAKKAGKTKAKAKTSKAKTKHVPRSERKDVPCCVNYDRALLRAIDAAARKADKSRARFMQETLAKRVGRKIAS